MQKKAMLFFIAMISSVHFCVAIAESILLPDCLLSVDESAFSGCVSIHEIYLPSGIQYIDNTAFNGAGETLWVHCYQGEVSKSLLLEGIDIDANTVCRALIIGQSYAGTNLALQGPANDARAIRFCLSALDRQNYLITQRTNLDATGIKDAITGTFSSATEYDISFFYYAGHGRESGVLVGCDESLLTPDELRNVLDGIPGRKVVIIDACFSGGILENENNPEDDLHTRSSGANQQGQAADLHSFNSAFLSAFSNSKKRGESTAIYSQYYVMTSAQYNEYSEEGLIESGSLSKVMGYFSYFLCKGCGWDGVRNVTVEQFADSDSNGVVSFSEAFTYAARETKNYYNQQDAQSNMSNCNSFSPFR